MAILQQEVVLIGLKDLEFKVGTTLTKIRGAMELSIDVAGDNQLIRGDDGVIAYAAQKTYAKVSVKQAVMSLTALAALTGNTVTETGTTPNTVDTFSFTAGAVPSGTLTGQVKFVKSITGVSGTLPADAHIVIPIFTIDPSSLKIGVKIGTENSVDFAGVAIPDANGIIYQIVFHETETAIT
ncbi:hypothetical protein [Caldisericum sp.]|uniref:hypothetical protein n=1 Tax=Caldisericum sp. TaxID=2499687 RepID=UPI003D0AF088